MQLGCPLTVPVLSTLPARIQACKRAGFSLVQFNITAEPGPEFRDALLQCAAEGMEVAAVGCYGNPLQPDARGPQGVCANDVFKIMEQLPPRQQPWNIVLWSGTLSGNYLIPHPGNHSPGVMKELMHWSRRVSLAMGSGNARLLFKPHTAHVLNTPDAVEDFMLDLDSTRVGVVLDPCNFLTPKNFHEREKHINGAIDQLAEYAGLATLKDARIEHFSIGFTMPGQGQIGYAGLLRQLKKRCPDLPWMIEAPESEQHLRTARAYVELQAKLAGISLDLQASGS